MVNITAITAGLNSATQDLTFIKSAFGFSSSTCQLQTSNCTFSGPLEPNETIAGTQILNSFLITNYLALIVSIHLLLHEWFWVERGTDFEQHGLQKQSPKGSKFKWLAQRSETALLSFSDQQSVAAIALLITVVQQGCTISAYHYNVSCFLAIFACITHLNSILNVRSYFTRGWGVAALRMLSMGTLIILTAIALYARSDKFPVDAGESLTLPAACFEIPDRQLNGTELIDVIKDTKWAVAKESGAQFGLVLLITAITLICLGVDGLKHLGKQPAKWTQVASWICRFLMGGLSVILSAWISYWYLHTRYAFESNIGLFDASKIIEHWSYSNIVTYALLFSSIYALFTSHDIDVLKHVASMHTQYEKLQSDGQDVQSIDKDGQQLQDDV